MATANPTDDLDDKVDDEELSAGVNNETLTPLIIDNGGGLIKTGLSGIDNPYQVHCLVGTPKHSRVMLQSPSTEKFFGDLAFKYRGLCKLSSPIKHGIIQNWNDMIQLWQYLYNDILEVKMTDHPVLITEEANNPISTKIRTTQIYLEYFNVPSIYFVPPPVLALYVQIIILSLHSKSKNKAHMMYYI